MAIPTWCHDGTALDLLRVARSQPKDPLPRQILASWLQDNAVATGDEDSCDLSEALQKSFSTDKLVLLPPETAQRLHPFVGALQGWFHGVQDNSDEVARLWLLAPHSIELAPGIWLELQLIPAGTFLMGSPAEEEDRDEDETQQEVTLTQPFLIGKYPVTQAQWQAVMGNNPSRFQGDNLPVERVSWDDARELCEKIREKIVLDSDFIEDFDIDLDGKQQDYEAICLLPFVTYDKIKKIFKNVELTQEQKEKSEVGKIYVI